MKNKIYSMAFFGLSMCIVITVFMFFQIEFEDAGNLSYVQQTDLLENYVIPTENTQSDETTNTSSQPTKVVEIHENGNYTVYEDENILIDENGTYNYDTLEEILPKIEKDMKEIDKVVDEFIGKDYKGVVNINTASLAMLCSLDGIGETLAHRIIKYRMEYGNFKSIDEIMLVSGIGNSKFESNKNRLSV